MNEKLHISEENAERLKKAALMAAPVVVPLAVRYARRHGVTLGFMYFSKESGIFHLGRFDHTQEPPRVSQVTGTIHGEEVQLEESLLEKLNGIGDVYGLVETADILDEEFGEREA